MKKNKPIKPRGVWKINPKTRVKPNKKKNQKQELCGNCDGQGFISGSIDADTGFYSNCQLCGGTGLQ